MARWIGIVLVLLAACGDVPFPTLFVFANPTNVEFCCDPSGAFPVTVQEFEVFAAGPTDSSINVSAYEVRIDYTSTSEAVTLSEPSGAELPLGSSTIGVLVDSCELDEALVDITIPLSGERTGGSTFQTAWIGKITVTNDCP